MSEELRFVDLQLPGGALSCQVMGAGRDGRLLRHAIVLQAHKARDLGAARAALLCAAGVIGMLPLAQLSDQGRADLAEIEARGFT